jgi:hypothetical protein
MKKVQPEKCPCCKVPDIQTENLKICLKCQAELIKIFEIKTNEL